MIKKKHIPWNKGLTKETDERVARYGMNGKTHTREAKQRMSKAHKDKKLSEGHKKKISEANIKRYIKYPNLKQQIIDNLQKNRHNFKKGCPSWNSGLTKESDKRIDYKRPTTFKKGCKISAETRQKISKARKGIKVSEEIRQKIRQTLTGRKRPEISGENSHMQRPEVREKLRLANLGCKNPAWRGGIACLPYSVDWTKTLRKSIRERDRYTCQICGSEQGDTTYPVHHIDYNKKNCNPNNLITLCKKCHMKTNHNRKYWIKYFKEKSMLGINQ